MWCSPKRYVALTNESKLTAFKAKQTDEPVWIVPIAAISASKDLIGRETSSNQTPVELQSSERRRD